MLNLTESIRQIKAVEYALEQVEVKGRDNMDKLLGSMQALSRIAANLERGMHELDAPAPAPAPVKLEVVEEETPAEEPAE